MCLIADRLRLLEVDGQLFARVQAFVAHNVRGDQLIQILLVSFVLRFKLIMVYHQMIAVLVLVREEDLLTFFPALRYFLLVRLVTFTLMTSVFHISIEGLAV